MTQRHKNFIPVSKKRAVRKELLYQVLVEDICNVFGAGDEERNKFFQLINGVPEGQVFGWEEAPVPFTPPIVEEQPPEEEENTPPPMDPKEVE